MGAMLVRLWCVVCVTTTMAMPVAHAGKDNREALARELMEVTGAALIGQQTMAGMLDQFKQMGLPDAFIDRFMAKADANALTDLVVPIYVELLDEKMLKAAIKFNRSKEGQALAAAMPLINQRAMAAGQAWGERIGEEVVAELEAEAAAAEE